jgi:hypothetical protein
MQVVLPWLLLALVPLCGFFVLLTAYYLRTSRQLKRLDSITKSPLFQTFSESLTGKHYPPLL